MSESCDAGIGLGDVLDGNYRLERLLDRSDTSIVYAGSMCDGSGEVFVEIFFAGLGDRSARASLLDIGRTPGGAWFAVTEAGKKKAVPTAPASVPVIEADRVEVSPTRLSTPPPLPARASSPPPAPLALDSVDLVEVADESAFEVPRAPNSLAPCVANLSPLDAAPANPFAVAAIDVPGMADDDDAPLPPTSRQKFARKVAFASLGLCGLLALGGLFLPKSEASQRSAASGGLVADTAAPPSGPSLGRVDTPAEPPPAAPAAAPAPKPELAMATMASFEKKKPKSKSIVKAAPHAKAKKGH